MQSIAMGAPPPELLVRSLYSSTGTPSTAKISVHYVDGLEAAAALALLTETAAADAAALGPLDCAAQVMPAVHPRPPPTCASSHIAVVMWDEGGSWWRERTIFVDVGGVSPSHWVVEKP